MAVILQDRDQAILAHVARYRLTTLDTVQHLFFPEAASAEAAKTVLRRLRATHLQSRPLYLRRVYYQLTAAAAQALGEPEEVANPFGPQALPRAYAVLAFCCHGPAERQRLARREFHERFPALSGQVPYNDYVVDPTATTPRLTRLLVDLGGAYQRLIRKCVGIIRAGHGTPGLRELLAADAFQIIILTGEVTKAQALSRGVQTHPALRGRFVRAAVIPELAHLLPNLQAGAA